MEKREIIESFANKRPEVLGAYGYGSGVFKQSTHYTDYIPQTDIIFITDDMRLWHKKNMELNSTDYSILGKIHFNGKNITRLKGKNNITYLSNIYENGCFFKYGVIEIEDYLNGLNTWNNIFVAGRFHKPVLEVISNDKIREAIAYNRKCALMIACLFCDQITEIYEIYRRLCSLSYCGDARMIFAENPNKVVNIVNGSFDRLREIYSLNEEYLTVFDDGIVNINHKMLLDKMGELPITLLNFLNEVNTDFTCLDIVRINIGMFFMCKNREESKNQMAEGIRTNGIVRSVPYVLAKVRKRVTK